MAEPAPQPESRSGNPAPLEHHSFIDVLKSYLGKVVTIVNPESYEDAPLGHQIRAGWYRAKPVGFGRDYLVVVTEYVHTGRRATKEAVKQYIPFSRIKRLSVMQSEVLIHI